MSKVDDYKRADGELFMAAYYYAFDTTDCEPVNRILSAVAIAGKSAHHTEAWSEGAASGKSLADAIQLEADRAAEHVAGLEHSVADLGVQLRDALALAESQKREVERLTSLLAEVTHQRDVLARKPIDVF